MALLTNIDIVNAACAVIGAEPIGDFDEDTFGGQAASLIYEKIVDFNLSLTQFSFAREIRQLSKIDGATPLTGWTVVYDIPGSTIGAPLWLTDDTTDPDRRFTRYILTGGRVHSDADPLFAMVRFRPDPRHWSATFRAATISAIAAEVAMALASDRQTHDTFMQKAYGTPSEQPRGGQMRAALTEDGIANPPRKPGWDNNPLTRAWRGGGGTFNSRGEQW
jgi:hypothetical protein